MTWQDEKREESFSEKVLSLAAGTLFLVILLGIVLFVKYIFDYGGWFATFVLIFLPFGLLSLFSIRASARNVGLLLTVYCVGMLPQVAFMIYYNSVVGRRYGWETVEEPRFGRWILSYEDFVGRVHERTEGMVGGGRLYVFIVASLIIVVLLTIVRHRLGRAATISVKAFNLFQVLLAGACSITLAANTAVGDWNPDFSQKLEARLREEDKLKTEFLLYDKIRQLQKSEQQSVNRPYFEIPIVLSKALYISDDELARVGRTEVQSFIEDQIQAKRDDYLQSFAKNLVTTSHVTIDNSPFWSRALVLSDREMTVSSESVIEVERSIDDKKKKIEIIRDQCIDSLSDLIGEFAPGSTAYVHAFAAAFVSDVAASVMEKISDKWDQKFGRRLSDWLTLEAGDQIASVVATAYHPTYQPGAEGFVNPVELSRDAKQWRERLVGNASEEVKKLQEERDARLAEMERARELAERAIREREARRAIR
jgi:hypothetical protein